MRFLTALSYRFSHHDWTVEGERRLCVNCGALHRRQEPPEELPDVQGQWVVLRRGNGNCRWLRL